MYDEKTQSRLVFTQNLKNIVNLDSEVFERDKDTEEIGGKTPKKTTVKESIQTHFNPESAVRIDLFWSMYDTKGAKGVRDKFFDATKSLLPESVFTMYEMPDTFPKSSFIFSVDGQYRDYTTKAETSTEKLSFVELDVLKLVKFKLPQSEPNRLSLLTDGIYRSPSKP